MMIQSLSTHHEGGICCLIAQCFNAIFLCCNVLFSGMLGSGLCLQNQALYCVSCAAVIVSLAVNVNVLFLSSFSIKEKLRLFLLFSCFRKPANDKCATK